MRDIYNVSLLDILPPSLSTDANVQAMAQSIDTQLQALTLPIKRLTMLFNINDLPEPVLDELAWQLHIDFYDRSLPIVQKRILIANSDKWHRRKGTLSAVEELIDTIFGDGTIEEWFEYGGDPYTFRIITSNTDITGDKAQQFVDALKTIKNCRSHLDSIQISVADDMNEYVGAGLHIGDYMTFEQVM